MNLHDRAESLKIGSYHNYLKYLRSYLIRIYITALTYTVLGPKSW